MKTNRQISLPALSKYSFGILFILLYNNILSLQPEIQIFGCKNLDSGPESTVEYYRLIIQAYRQQTLDGTYPRIMINSIDMTGMLNLIAVDDLSGLTAYLLTEIQKLAGAGASFGLLASNTPHVVFKVLQS
jgi:hypothetical protein